MANILDLDKSLASYLGEHYLPVGILGIYVAANFESQREITYRLTFAPNEVSNQPQNGCIMAIQNGPSGDSDQTARMRWLI